MSIAYSSIQKECSMIMNACTALLAWLLCRYVRMGREPIGQFMESHSDDVVQVLINVFVHACVTTVTLSGLMITV